MKKNDDIHAYSGSLYRVGGAGLRYGGEGRGLRNMLRFGSTYEKLVQLFKRVIDAKVMKQYKIKYDWSQLVTEC